MVVQWTNTYEVEMHAWKYKIFDWSVRVYRQSRRARVGWRGNGGSWVGWRTCLRTKSWYGGWIKSYCLCLWGNCRLKNSYTFTFTMHGFTYFTLQPLSHAVKEDSPLLHYNEYCIVHWCMTNKFTSKNCTLTIFWSPQLHSFCVHGT